MRSNRYNKNILKENIPENCRQCINNNNCLTYYSTLSCQEKWMKVEDENDIQNKQMGIDLDDYWRIN